MVDFFVRGKERSPLVRERPWGVWCLYLLIFKSEGYLPPLASESIKHLLSHSLSEYNKKETIDHTLTRITNTLYGG